MNKPITVICEEFKQSLANLINDSGLPAFVIESILQNYLNEARIAMNRQYQIDKDKYEKTLKENNNN